MKKQQQDNWLACLLGDLFQLVSLVSVWPTSFLLLLLLHVSCVYGINQGQQTDCLSPSITCDCTWGIAPLFSITLRSAAPLWLGPFSSDGQRLFRMKANVDIKPTAPARLIAARYCTRHNERSTFGLLFPPTNSRSTTILRWVMPREYLLAFFNCSARVCRKVGGAWSYGRRMWP